MPNIEPLLRLRHTARLLMSRYAIRRYAALRFAMLMLHDMMPDSHAAPSRHAATMLMLPLRHDAATAAYDASAVPPSRFRYDVSFSPLMPIYAMPPLSVCC